MVCFALRVVGVFKAGDLKKITANIITQIIRIKEIMIFILLIEIIPHLDVNYLKQSYIHYQFCSESIVKLGKDFNYKNAPPTCR